MRRSSSTSARRSSRRSGSSFLPVFRRVLIGLLALLLGAAGGAGLWARYGASDHGWITSGTHRYAGSGRAIVSGPLDADGIPNWLVGKARVVNFGPFDATYSSSGGSVVPGRPAVQTFGVKSGTQTATWKIRNGHLRVVVMNADASPGVVANAKVAVTVRGVLPIALSLLGVAIAVTSFE